MSSLPRLFKRLGLAALALWIVTTPASLAEDGGFPNIFQSIFGGGAKQPEAAPKPQSQSQPQTRRPRKKVRDFVPATTTRAPGAPGGAPVQPTFFIDVVGDSLAVLAADGLTEAFADKPEVSVANKARESSGLTRDDYYDWPKTARDLATGKDKIDFVVVMLGINDLQPMRLGAETLDPLGDKWRAAYAPRVEALVAPFRDAHIPVAWVGLPPMRGASFNTQAVSLNQIYREHADKAGAKYIDIWDAFADQSGQYDAYGPNVDGQNVKLRGADGIHFTKAGARKMAHFVEGEIRRVLEKGKPQGEVASLPPDIEQAADDINAQIRREMGAEPPPAPGQPVEPPKPLAGPILPLTARPLSPGGALIERPDASAASSNEALRALRVGQLPDPHAGRADDFSWPRL